MYSTAIVVPRLDIMIIFAFICKQRSKRLDLRSYHRIRSSSIAEGKADKGLGGRATIF